MFIRKWVDYSAKYGLGYILSDNSSGTNFNDNVKIVYASNDSPSFYLILEEISPVDHKKHLIITNHLYDEECPDPDIRRRVALYTSFRTYLDKRPLTKYCSKLASLNVPSN